METTPPAYVEGLLSMVSSFLDLTYLNW